MKWPPDSPYLTSYIIVTRMVIWHRGEIKEYLDVGGLWGPFFQLSLLQQPVKSFIHDAIYDASWREQLCFSYLGVLRNLVILCWIIGSPE